MRIRKLWVISLLFGIGADCLADSNDWRLTAAPPAMTETEKGPIGRTVCGERNFEMTENGVRCRICPDFTGDGGSDEGLEIGHMIRGQFTAEGAEGEWLLDTDGCEAHYDNFGGALLLARAAPEPVTVRPGLALGSSLAAKPAEAAPALIFYKPGFRLNDCLVFAGENTRTLLVCNEADVAQGEVIGHISVMEISRRGISRWRLLRWYNNSGSDAPRILSAVPTGMRRVELDDGQPGLQIELRILEATREAYEKAPDSLGETVNLVFQREGHRFFATATTKGHLERIGARIGKVLG